MVGNFVLITQARVSSTRLPGKVLYKIEGKTLLEIQVERLRRCKNVSKIIVATTLEKVDDKIVEECKRIKVHWFRGSEHDVLDRYYQLAKEENADWIIRVTSDCPLIDPFLIDKVIAFAIDNDVDYASNILIEEYPDGQDVEVMKFSALEKAWKFSTKKSDREHVTLYIRENIGGSEGSVFKGLNFAAPADYSGIRMTVDEKEDLELIKLLVSTYGTDKTWSDYTSAILKDNLQSINSHIIRNEGSLKSIKGD